MKANPLFPAGVICTILAVQQASHQEAGGRVRAGEPMPADVNRDAATAHAAYSAKAVL
jgi:hypothetical protein